MFLYAWAILFLPLLGFIGLSWFGDRLPGAKSGYAASAVVGAAFLVSFFAFGHLLSLEPEQRINNVAVLYPWIQAGSFHLDLAILVDPLSVFMLLIITGVGFLIHVYSIGYMDGDPEYTRFFSYMNLFIFSMALLVLAADFFFLIVGWALVGLASYLLIGFWTEKTSAVLAARKAFVMNVIGDVGMVIAAFVAFDAFGTLNFVEIFTEAPKLFGENDETVLLITLFLLVGAFAKSAQLPLHTWLPDAMEGPTPVSALIHAATMVTAGVYLVARCNVLYDLAPYAMYFIATVGATTAIFAGTIALVQNDIKRVIAYSTMSQLGYMFLAAGVGAYSLAMFHLMTHAFFKALLFLSAGSVIHGLHGEQDIRNMGGLKTAMPITCGVFLIGTLTLAGFPLTSGFFSKEAIIMSAYHAPMGNFLFWSLAVLTAGLTAFYSFRIFFYAFLGNSRNPQVKAHESPPIMLAPLAVLAFFSLVMGLAGPAVMHFLAPVFGGQIPVHYEDGLLESIALLAGLAGFVAVLGLYLTDEERLEMIKEALLPFHEILYKKYYVDELYDLLIVIPTKATGKFMDQLTEKKGIDFSVDKVGAVVKQISEEISAWQNGRVRTYALNMLAGVAIILLFVVFK